MQEQLTFSAPVNEVDGYTRRYLSGEHIGSVVLGFDGEREDRHFYLTILEKARTANVESEAVAGLLSIMNDDDELEWLIRESGYNERSSEIALSAHPA